MPNTGSCVVAAVPSCSRLQDKTTATDTGTGLGQSFAADDLYCSYSAASVQANAAHSSCCAAQSVQLRTALLKALQTIQQRHVPDSSSCLEAITSFCSHLQDGLSVLSTGTSFSHYFSLIICPAIQQLQLFILLLLSATTSAQE